jgi:hypothetical protein
MPPVYDGHIRTPQTYPPLFAHSVYSNIIIRPVTLPDDKPFTSFTNRLFNSRSASMSDIHQKEQKPQSGARVAIGIIGFIVGIFVILWVIKLLFGL